MPQFPLEQTPTSFSSAAGLSRDWHAPATPSFPALLWVGPALWECWMTGEGRIPGRVRVREWGQGQGAGFL